MFNRALGYDPVLIPNRDVSARALRQQVQASSVNWVSRFTILLTSSQIKGIVDGRRSTELTLEALDEWYMLDRKKFRKPRKKAVRPRVQKLPQRAIKQLRDYIHNGPNNTLLNRILEVKSTLKID